MIRLNVELNINTLVEDLITFYILDIYFYIRDLGFYETRTHKICRYNIRTCANNICKLSKFE